MKNIIAFQGNIGANSDIAARAMYPSMEGKSYRTFEEVFSAVENGEVEIGIIPIENSYAGRVSEIHNILPKTNLYIVKEYFLPINHFLLALFKFRTKMTKRQLMTIRHFYLN